MKKPYLTTEERNEFNKCSLRADLIRLDFSFKKTERDYYKKYWIFGKLFLRYNVNQMLKPINKQIKLNWKKSDGRRTF